MVSTVTLETNVNYPTSYVYWKYLSDVTINLDRWYTNMYAFSVNKPNDGLAGSLNVYNVRMNLLGGDDYLQLVILLDIRKTTTADVMQVRPTYWTIATGYVYGSWYNINANQDDIIYVKLSYKRKAGYLIDLKIVCATDRFWSSLVFTSISVTNISVDYNVSQILTYIGHRTTASNNYSELSVYPIWQTIDSSFHVNEPNFAYPSYLNLQSESQHLYILPYDAFVLQGEETKKLVSKDVIMIDKFIDYVDPLSDPVTGLKTKVNAPLFNSFDDHIGDLAEKLDTSLTLPSFNLRHVKIGKILGVELASPINAIIDGINLLGNAGKSGFEVTTDTMLNFFVALIKSGGKFMDAARLVLKTVLENATNVDNTISWINTYLKPRIQLYIISEMNSIFSWVKTNVINNLDPLDILPWITKLFNSTDVADVLSTNFLNVIKTWVNNAITSGSIVLDELMELMTKYIYENFLLGVLVDD